MSVEKPTRSLLCSTMWFVALVSRDDVIEVRFQQCMHRGPDQKWSSWYTKFSLLSRLAVVCNKGHEHEEFGPQKELEKKWCLTLQRRQNTLGNFATKWQQRRWSWQPPKRHLRGGPLRPKQRPLVEFLFGRGPLHRCQPSRPPEGSPEARSFPR